MELKDRLKYIRESEDVGVIQLAEKLGVSRSTINRYENGDTVPPHSVIKKFCHIFNVSQEWLETGEGYIYDYGDEDIYELVENIISGYLSFIACSMLYVIFSPTTAPILPIKKPLSIIHITTSSPLILPIPT